MEKNKTNKDLPQPNKSDNRWKEQDEFDSAGKLREEEDREKNESVEQHYKDSQDGNERMIQDSKKKQSEEDYRTDRKLPQVKK